MKPINLNQVRKARAKAQAKAEADQNAVRFGRSKATKDRDAMLRAKADKHLTDRKRDPE